MKNNTEENIQNVLIYQSTSGDMFYVTNTECQINLENVEMTCSDGYFLRVSGNSSERGWGKRRRQL